MTAQIQPINAETQAKNDVAIFNSRSRVNFSRIVKACRQQEEWGFEAIVDLVAPTTTVDARDELSWKIATFFSTVAAPAHKISLYDIRKAVGVVA